MSDQRTTPTRVAHAILRGLNLTYSDPQRVDEMNRLAFHLREYQTSLACADAMYAEDATIVEALVDAFEADLAAEGGTACPHLHIAVRGNDEAGFQGARCKDCEEELLRRPAADGIGYDYRTRDQWDAIDRQNVPGQPADEPRGAKSKRPADPGDELGAHASATWRAQQERNARDHIEHVAKTLEDAAASVRRYAESFDRMENRRKKADVLGWVVNHMMTAVLNNCRLDLLVDDAAKLGGGERA